MPTTIRWRRVVALPVITALATSGAVLGSTSVQASPATTAATTPTAASPAADVTTGLATKAKSKKVRKARVRKIRQAARIAVGQVGDPYSYGGDGPGAFDCSGLTQYAYGRAGLNLPRVSSHQPGAVRIRKKKSNARRGDLVFFHDGGSVYHVGMHLGRAGGNQIVHASTPGTDVKRDPIWTSSYFVGTKIPRRR